jgi:hypothetical protein
VSLPAAPAWTDALAELRACEEAVTWAKGYGSLDAAWAACERGDWMLWLAGRLGGPPESGQRKTLVLCACACARLALPYVPTGETRPLAAIETAERWARGEATLDEVRVARRAAAAYAASAAAAAADAAAADAAAAYAAAADAAAAYAADAAAAYAAKAAARKIKRAEVLKQCANIVRKYYPKCPLDGAP